MKDTDLLNLVVKHKVYGTGVITDVDGNYITVQFDSKVAKFLYPDSFEKFIVAKDPSIQRVILEEIRVYKHAVEMQRQAEAAVQAAERHSVNEEQALPKIKRHRSIEDGFRSDYNVKHLAKHPILTYQQVEDQFGIKISGFGKGINKTESTVILVSSIDKKKGGFVYHDHWTTDGDYIYSGEGKTGDQKMTSGNKAIVDAEIQGKQIHLFVKFSPQEYYYQGIFSLVDYTYEDDKDESGNLRKEYKFRLRKMPKGGQIRENGESSGGRNS